MNRLLQKKNLTSAWILCFAVASILPALAESAQTIGNANQNASGKTQTGEATQRAINTKTTYTQPQSETAQVPPIPPAETGNLSTNSQAVQENSAIPTLETLKQTESKPSATTIPEAVVVPSVQSTSDQHSQQVPAAATAQEASTTESGTSQSNPPAQGAETTVLAPNGAALQTQMLPLSGPEGSPWTSYAAGAFLILGLAAAGVMLVRLRQGRAFGTQRSERQMQLISTLALSPKRQILLVRIRDKEVAVAATEHGMTVLTELPAPTKSLSQALDDSGTEEPRRRKLQQRVVNEEPVKLVAAEAGPLGEETAVARSEMLMGALKSLREKHQRSRSAIPAAETTTQTRAPASETTANEKQLFDTLSDGKSRGEPTMKQTRAAFPKYLANAFEQESKRTLSQGTSSANSGSNSDDANNVTNMIRERLKDLRPLS